MEHRQHSWSPSHRTSEGMGFSDLADDWLNPLSSGQTIADAADLTGKPAIYHSATSFTWSAESPHLILIARLPCHPTDFPDDFIGQALAAFSGRDTPTIPYLPEEQGVSTHARTLSPWVHSTTAFDSLPACWGVIDWVPLARPAGPYLPKHAGRQGTQPRVPPQRLRTTQSQHE